MQKIFSAKILGGDEIHLSLQIDGDAIQSCSYKVVGSLQLMHSVHEWYRNLPKNISSIVLPAGKDMSTLLLREVLCKVKGEWSDGDDDPEICHCRKVAQATIERAIVLGAHNLEKIRKRTSANTGCGACMPDIEELLTKRLR